MGLNWKIPIILKEAATINLKQETALKPCLALFPINLTRPNNIEESNHLLSIEQSF
jgi:hypothetical protein